MLPSCVTNRSTFSCSTWPQQFHCVVKKTSTDKNNRGVIQSLQSITHHCEYFSRLVVFKCACTYICHASISTSLVSSMEIHPYLVFSLTLILIFYCIIAVGRFISIITTQLSQCGFGRNGMRFSSVFFKIFLKTQSLYKNVW